MAKYRSKGKKQHTAVAEIEIELNRFGLGGQFLFLQILSLTCNQGRLGWWPN